MKCQYAILCYALIDLAICTGLLLTYHSDQLCGFTLIMGVNVIAMVILGLPLIFAQHPFESVRLRILMFICMIPTVARDFKLVQQFNDCHMRDVWIINGLLTFGWIIDWSWTVASLRSQ